MKQKPLLPIFLIEKERRREGGREDAISRKECNIKAFSLFKVFSHPGALLWICGQLR